MRAERESGFGETVAEIGKKKADNHFVESRQSTNQSNTKIFRGDYKQLGVNYVVFNPKQHYFKDGSSADDDEINIQLVFNPSCRCPFFELRVRHPQIDLAQQAKVEVSLKAFLRVLTSSRFTVYPDS